MSARLSHRVLWLAALVWFSVPAQSYLRTGGARKVRRRMCIVDRIPVQEDFNLAKFGGKWYEIARVRHHSFRGHPDLVSIGGAFVFNVKPNGRDASVSYFGKLDGRCQLMIPGRLMTTSYDPPAKLTYKFAGFNYPFDEGDLWILDTDYQNYALLYNCLVRNSDGTCRRNMNLAWILSRKPTLPAETRKRLDQKLYTVCVIPYNRLTNTPHNGDDCSPSLTTSTPAIPTTTVHIPSTTTTTTAEPTTTTLLPTTPVPTTTTIATTITMAPTTVPAETTTEQTIVEEDNDLGSGYLFYRVEDGPESSGLGCQDLDCSLSCAGGYREDDYGCEICACRDEVPVEQNRLSRRLPTFCQELTCDLHCPHGYRTDDYDCEVCECEPPGTDYAVSFRAAQAQTPICRPPDCEWMHCDWGLDQDESGCEVCRCREDPDRRCRRTFQTGVSKCFDDFQRTSQRNVHNDPQEYCRAQSGLYRCYGEILFTSGCSQEIMASLYEEHIRQGLEYVRRYCLQWVQYARRQESASHEEFLTTLPPEIITFRTTTSPTTTTQPTTTPTTTPTVPPTTPPTTPPTPPPPPKTTAPPPDRQNDRLRDEGVEDDEEGTTKEKSAEIEGNKHEDVRKTYEADSANLEGGSSVGTSRTGSRRTTVTSPIVRIRTDGRTNRGGKKKIKNGRKPPARLRGRQRTVSASSGVTTSWEATSVLSSLVESTRGFALGLFRRLCDSTDRNIVFSPLSISAAMAMTYIGARGNTRYQMEKVLRFHHFRNEADMHSTFSAIEDVISTSGKEAQYTFVQANRLFGQAGMSFRHDFLMDTSRHYHSSLATVEFSDEEMARLAINSWVAGKTGGKVNGVIPQGLLKPLTKLVLVNAVYFAGKWRTEFDPQVINMADFYVSPERAENVPMMQLSGEFNVTEDPNLDCAAVELPYSGNEIVMDIILPNQRDGLDRLQSQLTRRALNRIFRRYLPLEGSVFLPRFRLTEEFSLKAQLTAMGLDDLFSQNRADLSGMTAQPGMHVSDALHKAVIEVSEEETEGATALTAAVTARSRRGFEFRADHPFMFFIRDKRTGTVLFLGRLVDPRN